MKKYWIRSLEHFENVIKSIDEENKYIWKAGERPLKFTPYPKQYPYIIIIDLNDNRMYFSSDINSKGSELYKSKQIGYTDVEGYKLKTKQEKLKDKLKEFKL